MCSVSLTVITNWSGTSWTEQNPTVCDKDLTWQFYSCAVHGGLKQQKEAWVTVADLCCSCRDKCSCQEKLKTCILLSVFSSPALYDTGWMWGPAVFFTLKTLRKQLWFCEENVFINCHWKPFGLSLVGYFAFQNDDCILDCWITSLMLCCRLACNILFSSPV